MRRWTGWLGLALAVAACTGDQVDVEVDRAERSPTSSLLAPPDTAPASNGPATVPPPPATDEPATTATAPAPGGGNGVGDELFPELGARGIDVTHYDVQLTVDPVADALSGVVALDVTATALLDEVWIDALASLTIASVELDAAPVAFEHRADEIVVEPPVPLRPGDERTITITYSAVPDSFASAVGLGVGWFDTDGGAFTLNEPDGLSSWLPANEHPSDKATWEFRITVPDGLEAVANGLPDDAMGSLDAAGAQRTFTWRLAEQMAPYLVQVLIGDYEVSQSVTPRGLPLIDAVVAEAAARTDLAALRATTAAQIAFFEPLFGPYPLQSYGVALADSPSGEAMETQGRSQFSADDIDGRSDYLEELLLAHELAHQWFGNAVSPARWSDVWLNESLATYAQWLWLDHVDLLELEGEAEVHLAARQDGGESTGAPRLDNLFGYERYDGGAVVVHALRRTLGDADFSTLLRRWVAGNAGTSRTTADFIALAEDVAGTDLDAFFDEWLFATDLPDAFPS
jgi:aminopeptidase N